MTTAIPLRWVKNDEDGARFAFQYQNGRWTYMGTAIVEADFPLSYETLAPYVTQVLDITASWEAMSLWPVLVDIREGQVKVF